VRTECNTVAVEFTPYKRQQTLGRFDAGAISSDGGVMLLREVDRRLGLFDRVSELIADPRDPALIEHDQRTLIAQRVLAIACGWEDLNDHHTLRHDAVHQLAGGRGADRQRPLGSPATLCRLENRVDRDACVAINALLVELFVESQIERFKGRTPDPIALDFDATDDPVHGRQEQRFFHGYYDQYCYLPLYVFAGEQLLCAYLRPANIDEGRHAWAILALIVKRLRQQWPDVKIVFRGDSGFCRWKMLRWCDRHGVDYIVGLAKNARSLAAAQGLMATAETAFNDAQQHQRLIGEIDYASRTWSRWRNSPRRVIARIEHGDKGSNPRFILTSLRGDPVELYETIYCARGEMENRIKEQQLGLFADRTSCTKFVANQFRLLLSSLAYVLIETLRRLGLNGTELARAQATTIRLKLLKIGTLVRTSVRRVVLHLSEAYPLQRLLETVLTRLRMPAPN
jgi:hypothetical protein